MAVVEADAVIARMVWMMWVVWVMRIKRIVVIGPVTAEVKRRICPIIWCVVVIWIPIWIPAVVIIWPSEAGSEFHCDVSFG